mmetsp:Transcript_43998/g.102673  ORF Transcript_43998/g.102673 Transcript_43998/m.102673 type:complete len:244 (+) Transcript_43998:249-980(+)
MCQRRARARRTSPGTVGSRSVRRKESPGMQQQIGVTKSPKTQAARGKTGKTRTNGSQQVVVEPSGRKPKLGRSRTPGRRTIGRRRMAGKQIGTAKARVSKIGQVARVQASGMTTGKQSPAKVRTGAMAPPKLHGAARAKTGSPKALGSSKDGAGQITALQSPSGPDQQRRRASARSGGTQWLLTATATCETDGSPLGGMTAGNMTTEIMAMTREIAVSQIANGPAAAHALHRVVITMKFPGGA